MRYLVTGGAGFIGSHFIRKILKDKNTDKVINVDKLTYAGNLKNTEDFKNDDRYSFTHMDINEPDIYPFIEESDVVVNFAAETHVDRSIENANEFIKTDIMGTYNLLNACKKYFVPFVQISTDEVYGPASYHSFSEESPMNPMNPYSASKAGAELMVRSFANTHKIKFKITRSSNNYGPFQHPEKLIPLFITNLIKKRKVPLYGDGLNVRDWIYVEDNVDGIIKVIKEGDYGETYNIGGDCLKNNIEITKELLAYFGMKEEMINWVDDRPGHDRKYWIDSSKARVNLGWKPKHDFKQAMIKTIKWYESNKTWWEPLQKKQ